MKKNFLTGAKVSVVGLGRSGIAAANLARSMGAEVLCSEVRSMDKCTRDLALLAPGVTVEFEGHSDTILGSDIVIKSPGVHGDIPIFKKLKQRKVPVWSEIELALKVIRYKTLIAITGTNGKTTTTTLVGELFKNAGRHTAVAGNIGAPLASVTETVGADSAIVVEMSSYQLEDSSEFHPHIAALLNITPDHLEHHHTMENYIAAKAKIFANQTAKDYCVLNYDDPVSRELARKCKGKVIFFSRKEELNKGVYYSKGSICVKLSFMNAVIPCSPRIPGMHNIENILASVAIAAAGGLDPVIIGTVINMFPGVEHRIELVTEIKGAKYYNDSKATNVDSTRVAVESFSDPLWLILGGRDKGAPYTPLRELIREKVSGILLIGEAAQKIEKDLAGTTRFYNCGTMENAIRKAYSLAQPGEVVLLSPACASFDQFKDFEDRGRQFKAWVRKLR